MSDPQGIDVQRVTAWMADNIDGITPPLAFTRIKGGHSNLTYRIDDDAGRSVVLRRPPMGELLPTAHDMSREWRLISAFHPTPVPVPEPLGFCEDPDVTGKHFYVMSYVDGHVLHDASVAEAYTEEQRRVASESFVDVLAAMHAEEPDDIGLDGFARKEGYIARQLDRWYKQWNGSKTRELPLVDELYERFSAGIPEQPPARVVHGDYRLGNCLASKDTGAIAAVLDWEIATLGDPLADLGYVLHTWAEPGEFVARGGPTSAPGFLTRAEVVERYAEASGADLSNIDFYTAFAHWKTACIVEGVYARYLQGALDTSGVNLDGFKLSVEMAVQRADESLQRLGV